MSRWHRRNRKTNATYNRRVDLLIVDDEASLRDFLSIVFEEDDWHVTTADSLAAARAALQKNEPELILCDLMLPDGSGLDLLREVKTQTPSVAVIMITAHTSTKSAVEALKAGAFDYIAKPFDIEELKIIVRNAVERKELEDENIHLRSALEERFTFANIIGKSPKMQEIFTIVQRIAKTSSTVLISGESGTGKELIARAIHYNSGRRGKFVSINCGALPETLLESELFGHERGAFTGAIREKRGLFQEADRGTIFLDEIGETSTAMQIKLLRVLQDRIVRKVGSNVASEVLTTKSLPEHVLIGSNIPDMTFELPPEGISLEHHLESIAKVFMLKALERAGGVQTQAAELLRMSFRSFRYYAKKYELIAREKDEVVEVENEK